MNPSTRLARVIVEALADLGVQQAVLCPGSRSAPLAYALLTATRQGRIRLQVRIDERSAGFVALGAALADPTGAPAVVITTSGTAVANLHPAVLEAAHAGVPLLVISADRPHELRGSGANQTTDQVRLFGIATRWFAEIPSPQGGFEQEPVWRNIVARAVAAARGNPGGDPGPVQLNVAFSEPLVPEPSEAERLSPSQPELSPSQAESSPSQAERSSRVVGLTRVSAPAVPVPVRLPAGVRTVVLAGAGAGAEAAMLAEAAGWPLLAEPSSGARVTGAVCPYRLLLDRQDLGAAIERVVVLGRPTLSRPVSRLLARADVEVVVVSQRPDWTDAGRRAALVVPAVEADTTEPDPGWVAAWRWAGTAVGAAIDRVLDAEASFGRLTGPLVAREVAAATGPGDVLFAGASNPIRDLDLAAGPFDPTATVLANRGLAGIDGTLSSACGVALARAGSGGRVRALVGDLTFLHDVGGLLSGTLEPRPNLQIVVLDDAGGGIFGLLEQGALAATDPMHHAEFERVFGTPQDVDLAALCRGYRADHELVDDLAQLRKTLADPVPGISVIQVRVDRSGHRDLAARLAAAAQQAL